MDHIIDTPILILNHHRGIGLFIFMEARPADDIIVKKLNYDFDFSSFSCDEETCNQSLGTIAC
jgi:hypothetical protein